MKLHKVKLKNFRCFEEFEIEFEPEFMLHVLIAENMVGKSALLRALRIMLGSYLKGFTGNNLEPGITRNDHRIIGTNPLANLARQCEIQAEASLVQSNGKQVHVSWKRYKTQLLSERTKTQNLSGDLSSLAADQYDATVAGKGCLPLLLFISPDSFTQARNTRQFDLQGAALQGYWYSLQAKSISAFVLDFLERMELIREEQVHKESTKRLYEDLPQTFLDFFQKILKITLPEIEAVEWIRDPNHNQANAENEEDSEAAPQSAMTLSFIFDDGRVCLYDMLSDGYRYLTLLAGELAIRSLLLNRHLGVEVGNHISGVVLIDEFGIHLHPGLQQKALQRLASAFPKVQFIVTTHSPLLLNGLDKKQIHIIEADEQGKRTVRNPEQDIIGLGAEGILLDVFGLESTFDTKTIKRLDRYQKLTRQRILDQLSAAEKAELGELIDQLGGLTYDGAAQDPLYRKLLRRLEEYRNQAVSTDLSEEEVVDQVIGELLADWSQSS